MATTTTTIRIAALDHASSVFGRIAKNVNTATRSMQRAQQRMRAVSQSMTSVGMGASLAITAPVAAAARSLEGVNRELSAAQNNLAAISGIDITTVGGAQQFRELSDAAKAAADQIGLVTQTQALQAQGFMAMAGMSRDAIAGATLPVLQMAVGLKLDAAVVSDKLTNIASALNLDISTSEAAARTLARIGDLVATAATNANVSAAQVFESLKSAAPVAAAMGMDLESTLGLVMAMGDKGVQGGEAGTALKSTAARFLAPTKQARETFAAAGIDPSSYFTDIRPPDFSGLSKALAESGIATTQQLLAQQSQINTILGDTGRTVSERITAIREHLSGALNLTGEDGAALARSIGDYASGLGGSFDFPRLLADMDRMGISAAQQAQIIGKNHFARISGLISSIEKAQGYTTKLREDADGAMAGQVKARTQGLDGATEAFAASQKKLAGALGDAGFTQASINFKRRMIGVMDAVAKMDKTLLASGMKFVAWGAALGPGLIALGALSRAAAFGLSPFIALTRIVGTSSLALTRQAAAAATAKGGMAALSMLRILPVAGFAAAAVGIGWAVKSILGNVSALPEIAGPLRDVQLAWGRLMTGMRSGVDGAVRVGLDGLTESLRDLTAALGNALAQASGDWFANTFGDDALTNLKSLGAATGDIGAGLKSAFNGAFNLDLSAVTSGLGDAGTALAAFGSSFVRVAATVGRGLMERFLPESALAALDKATGYIANLGKALTAGFSASVDLSSLSGLSGVLNSVKSSLSGATASLTAFLAPPARQTSLAALEAVRRVTAALPGLFRNIGAIAGAALGATTSALVSLASGFATAFNLDAIANALQSLRGTAGDAITSIGNALSSLPVIGSLFDDDAADGAGSVQRAIAAIGSAAEWLKGPLTTAGKLLGELASYASSGALTGFALVIEGISLAIQGIAGAVKLAVAGVRNLIDWLGKIEMPDSIGMFGFDFNFPDMPDFDMPDLSGLTKAIGSYLGLRAAIESVIVVMRRLAATKIGGFFARLIGPLISFKLAGGAASKAITLLAAAGSKLIGVFARLFLSRRAIAFMVLSEAIFAVRNNIDQLTRDLGPAFAQIAKGFKAFNFREFDKGLKMFEKALLPTLKELAKSPMLIASIGAAVAWKYSGKAAALLWNKGFLGVKALAGFVAGAIGVLARGAWAATGKAAGVLWSAGMRGAMLIAAGISKVVGALGAVQWAAMGRRAGGAFSAAMRTMMTVAAAVGQIIASVAGAAWRATGLVAGAAFSAGLRVAMVVGTAVANMIAALGGGAWRAAGLVAGATFSAGFKVASKLGAVTTGIVTGLGSGLSTGIGGKAMGWGKTAMRVVGRGLLRAIPFVGLGILAYEIGSLIYNNFSDEIWAAVDKLKAWFKTKLEWLLKVAGELKDAASAAFGALGAAIADAIREPFAAVLDWFGEKLNGLVGLAKSVAQALGFVAADEEQPRPNPHPAIYKAPAAVSQMGAVELQNPRIMAALGGKKSGAGLFSGLEQRARDAGGVEDQGPSLLGRWFGSSEPANEGAAPALALPAMPQINVPQPVVNNIAGGGAEVITLPQIERVEVSTPTAPTMPEMAAPGRLGTTYLDAATRAFFAQPAPAAQPAGQGDLAPKSTTRPPILGRAIAPREMPPSFSERAVVDASGARIEAAINTLSAAIQSGAIRAKIDGKADVSVRVRADGSLTSTGSAVSKGDVSVGLDVGTDPTAP